MKEREREKLTYEIDRCNERVRSIGEESICADENESEKETDEMR
ncbi:unnamed protein product [Camellia sinensis]